MIFPSKFSPITRPRAERIRGFAVIELWVALILAGVLFYGVVAVTRAFEWTVRITGHDTFGSDVVAINPDRTVALAARTVSTEMLALAEQSRFVVCADQAMDPTAAQTTAALPLANLSVAELKNATAVRTGLADGGLQFSNTGFTVWGVGSNNQVIFTLVVAYQSVSAASNGDSFVRYTTTLYGGDVTGYGELARYDFVSPSQSAQGIATPVLVTSQWHISLPDPNAPSSLPDGSAFSGTISSSLTYDLTAHF